MNIIRTPQLDSPGPLVVRGLNWLGDAVISFPAIRAIKRFNPSRELVCVSRPGAADVYESLDAFSTVIAEERPVLSRLALAMKLRALKPAGMLVLPNSLSTGLLAKVTNAPVRIGRAKNLRSVFLTKAVTFTPQEEAAHETFKFLRLVSELGLPSPYTRPAIARPCQPDGFSLPEGLRLALAPGASYGTAKRWPAESFAQAAKLILEGRKGGVVILGTQAESQAAKDAQDALKGVPETLNLAGQLSVKEVIAVLSCCHLTLCNDSGLMHLSAALDVPVVAMFGPTNPVKTSPLARRGTVLRNPAPCSPCRYRDCPKANRICFDGLTPDLVATAATNLLVPFRNSRKTVIWSPTADQIWPLQPIAGVNFYASATEIAKAGGQPATAPSWMKIVWQPLETANDWWGLIHAAKLDPSTAFWVGDTERSITLANATGGRSVLVTTLRAQKIIPDLLANGTTPTIAAPDAEKSMDWIASF
ncbi:MAG: lipopolysaccharide heptosyltransferase II [Deltaproteobacteria bacterium]|jgi:heptosyltransferase-2|nr:lipopolysaccharide heptosyltransferase II [Deltaproteobacteria bacterium]